ncbi:MAG: tRNA pseudouridine(38-40) synthase TruA [Saprospiraceae bacterium]|jgi:tRNA pseudouridine38-40 synthase|nr:tRNA pseudouridine(38-40) synthase TruA [Saprospiraceae bacterium]MBP9209724.1 tRNA pseudouridine(38-40) synthase TruA [Saprospiraceae bacterium]MBV6474101.1 tRNA pseudouridine synthase A [Saprospiraceae bacterium]
MAPLSETGLTRRLVCEIAYRGGDYHGWQVQPGTKTVQSAIEEACSVLARSTIQVTGCGRTDAGVHAAQYFLHFDVDATAVAAFSKRALNGLLPSDIAIRQVYRAPENFHARYDANRRKYIYRLHTEKDPFSPFNSCQFPFAGQLSLQDLNQAAGLLDGMTEFPSFTLSGHQLNHFRCTLYENQWRETGPRSWEYHIAANRFLRGMVRLITGMCIQYGLGKTSLESLSMSLREGRQVEKSLSMPAPGLTLEEVGYPPEIWERLQALDAGV